MYDNKKLPSREAGIRQPGPSRPNRGQPGYRPGRGPSKQQYRGQRQGLSINRPGQNRTRPQPRALPPRITGQFGGMGEAYDYHKNSSYGFVRDPSSPSGWSYVNQFGQVADARKPMNRRERDMVISKQRMLGINPYFYDEGRKKPASSFTAPWLEGFTGGGDWQPMTGGGWFNTRNWSSWKPGDAIPGRPSDSGVASAPAGDDFYAQLLRAFGVGV